MEKYALLKEIFNNMDYLSGKLWLEKVVFEAKLNKAYFLFSSKVFVDTPEFLRIEKIVQKFYPYMNVSIRVVCPDLKDDFLKDIGAYKNVLENFLMRNTNAARTWLKNTGWELNNGRILLTCPDEHAEHFYKSHNFDEKISQAVWDIFRVKLPVVFVVTSRRDEWINKMREMRGEFDEIQNKADDQSTLQEPIADYETKNIKKANKNIPKEKKEIKREKKEYIPQQEVLYGKKIEGVCSPISSCVEDAGYITVNGVVGKPEARELKGGKTQLLTFTLGDDSGTVYCKCFLSYGMRGNFKKSDGSLDFELAKKHSREAIIAMVNGIKAGERLLLSGECVYDNFLHEPCITVKAMSRMPAESFSDNSSKKRVELHLHTQMSALDATSSAKELIERAASFGHKAIAITDHGVVQSFPEAFATAKAKKIKFIPGCEIYLCDYESPINNPTDRSLDEAIVIVDFETTGLSTINDKIIEIGAVKLQHGTVVDSLSLLVNPGVALSPIITKITGITDLMLVNKPDPSAAVNILLDFIGDCPIAAHNSSFDMGMLNSQLKRMGKKLSPTVLDTLVLARALYPDMKSYKLSSLCKALGVSLKNAHRAVHDATATAQCLSAMFKKLADDDINTYNDITDKLSHSTFGHSKHACVLVSEQAGLHNLYYLISQGHLKYFRRNMRVPRFELENHREGLLIGSACSEGELYQAVLHGSDDEELAKIASFYDYIEIMPIENNAYLVRENHVGSYEDLRNINRKLLSLGDSLGIPVVATGDVHYLNPADSVHRAMMQASMNYSDFDKQPPLYYRNTEDMLEAFSYLGEENAYRLVVENSNLIANKIANIRQYPKHPDGEKAVTFQPYWEDAAENIRSCTYENAYAIYGNPLPDVVLKRIEKELNSIIGYGFATLYNIAQKIVQKSNSDGYVVGSRGSVGSSFVATMCGITEVNPLPPHYICNNCHKSYFDVQKGYTTGIDLPDKLCPDCNATMKKDGYDIPFEVFLGFKGDKVPDIDLNFSGEYQSKAHAYVEELFGKGYVYRAGTISALKDKTAFGYVNKYLELKGKSASRAHKERLAQGLVGVKRTTGQHPGGMVVLPKDYSIYQFTPIQHPADDITGDTITTHFDFNSMHDILVKLDVLGHDDPTMLHMLEKLTGVSYLDIPLDDKKVMSLFISPDALEIGNNDILSPTGTLGIPEFGTDFVQAMLLETKPTTMEELLRISGLSHGTDVWVGNAQELIKSGIATLSQCVCTRDDIMNTLIGYDLESKLSFDIMEAVRKGKGLSDEAENAMRSKFVPEWYIDSCNKIKYMFPKAHASAYVLMALRIAYYKVHYPLAYYAAYFTIRSKGFNAASMLLNPDILRDKILQIRANENSMSVKDEEELYAMRMVLEMLCRGFKFLNADIYKSDSKIFLIEGDDSLRVPLSSLPGLGDTVAENIVSVRDIPFKTIDDLKQRAKIGNAIVDLLRDNKAIESLPESAQTDMFSMFDIN